MDEQTLERSVVAMLPLDGLTVARVELTADSLHIEFEPGASLAVRSEPHLACLSAALEATRISEVTSV